MIIIVIVCVCAQCMIKNTTWSRWFSYFVHSATAAAAATAAAVIVVVVAIFDVLNAHHNAMVTVLNPLNCTCYE